MLAAPASLAERPQSPSYDKISWKIETPSEKSAYEIRCDDTLASALSLNFVTSGANESNVIAHDNLLRLLRNRNATFAYNARARRTLVQNCGSIPAKDAPLNDPELVLNSRATVIHNRKSYWQALTRFHLLGFSLVKAPFVLSNALLALDPRRTLFATARRVFFSSDKAPRFAGPPTVLPAVCRVRAIVEVQLTDRLARRARSRNQRWYDVS